MSSLIVLPASEVPTASEHVAINVAAPPVLTVDNQPEPTIDTAVLDIERLCRDILFPGESNTDIISTMPQITQRKVELLFICLSRVTTSTGQYKDIYASFLKSKIFELTSAAVITRSLISNITKNPYFSENLSLKSTLEKAEYLSKSRWWGRDTRFTHHMSKRFSTNSSVALGLSSFLLGTFTTIVSSTSTIINGSGDSALGPIGISAGITFTALPFAGAAVCAYYDEP